MQFSDISTSLLWNVNLPSLPYFKIFLILLTDFVAVVVILPISLADDTVLYYEPAKNRSKKACYKAIAVF